MNAAAFTITRNEPLFLRIWLNYYCPIFGPENCYIIDNQTTDGSVIASKALWPTTKVKTIYHDSTFDMEWMTNLVMTTQRMLLNNHDLVVFSDTDELLIPSIRYVNLKDYCDQLMATGKKHARAQGWSVIHQPTEPSLTRQPGEKVLTNRSKIWHTLSYDKTLITREPLHYTLGFHDLHTGNDVIDSDLDLVHLWCLDRAEFERRHGPRAGEGYFDRIMESECVSPWYSGQKWFYGDAQNIPNHWVDRVYL